MNARLVACLLGFVAGCGARAPAAVPSSKPNPNEGAQLRNPATSSPSNGGPSLDALAARGATDAPLMRELLRAEQVERTSPRAAVIRAERDLCVRAVFAASREVRVWFADEGDTPRGESATGTTGTVPPRGPACAKKGETLRLVVDKTDPAAGESSTRAVIFAAP